MQALFGRHLRGVPAEVMEAVRRVPIVHAPFAGSPDLVGALGQSGYKGSNNWAVAARRSATGGALYASDPHLEVNRHAEKILDVLVILAL